MASAGFRGDSNLRFMNYLLPLHNRCGTAPFTCTCERIVGWNNETKMRANYFLDKMLFLRNLRYTCQSGFLVFTSRFLDFYIAASTREMINRAEEISESYALAVEDRTACLRSNFSAFPDYQLRIMLQCQHPSGACSQFDREDIEQSIAGRF